MKIGSAILNLTRGNTHGDQQKRIEERAMALVQGAWWATEHDAGDINSNEDAEIEAAVDLANQWMEVL